MSKSQGGGDFSPRSIPAASQRTPEPPGPRGQLILGSLLDLLQHPIDFLMHAGSFGELAHFHLGPHHAYLVKDPDYLQDVFVKQADRIGRNVLGKNAAKKFVGESLPLLDGERHHRVRKLLMQAFHNPRMEGYAAIMAEQAQRLVERWREQPQIALVYEMQAYAANVGCRALLGSDVTGQTSTSQIIKAMADFQAALALEARNFIPLPDWLPLPHKLRMKRSIATLHGFIREIIQTRRQSPQDQGDVLSILLSAVDEKTGQRMTEEQLRYEAISLFIVGHETTSGLLSWVPYLLDRHPAVYASVLKELDETLKGRPPSWSELPHLTYMEQVIKETLRLYPTAWIISRTALADLTLGPYTIRKGRSVFASPFVTQRDARYFPEPLRFRPERFAPGATKPPPRFAYFPFGIGATACIGQQFAMATTKIVLATLLQRYRLVSTTKEEVAPVGLITLRTEREIFMQLHPRTPIF